MKLDLGEELLAALESPRGRAVLREVFLAVLEERTTERRTKREAAVRSTGDRLLTSEEMARAIGMSRATFLRKVQNRFPEIARLKVDDRWPEQAVRRIWDSIRETYAEAAERDA